MKKKVASKTQLPNANIDPQLQNMIQTMYQQLQQSQSATSKDNRRVKFCPVANIQPFYQSSILK